jgi:hypothetical protein
MKTQPSPRPGHGLAGPPEHRGFVPNLLYVDYCEFARVSDVALFATGTPFFEAIESPVVPRSGIEPPTSGFSIRPLIAPFIVTK